MTRRSRVNASHRRDYYPAPTILYPPAAFLHPRWTNELQRPRLRHPAHPTRLRRGTAAKPASLATLRQEPFEKLAVAPGSFDGRHMVETGVLSVVDLRSARV